MSKSVARYMVARFVRAIEELGRTGIWNRRCKVTVDWERERGITSVSKRARGRTCGGGHNRSRSNFMGSAHSQRPARDMDEIRAEADRRLVQGLCQQLELTLMERLGGCKFLMTVDTG
ncbi:hypothetical protein BC939DRAFT_503999 [Gamsiella multidivaricata]|uniref:uncharacterized protein n=1 Tax=Gamsiella multidivaricata TaxID=101098 RepID=UPI00221E56DE|nr:uncharacterized protein BC939DRAFT_503999 [Gamsiella multidivaricata]KAI7822223.1 hypothetical protein BC939DRAFT_503999 [Gamsiella multidivaricata]